MRTPGSRWERRVLRRLQDRTCVFRLLLVAICGWCQLLFAGIGFDPLKQTLSRIWVIPRTIYGRLQIIFVVVFLVFSILLDDFIFGKAVLVLFIISLIVVLIFLRVTRWREQVT